MVIEAERTGAIPVQLPGRSLQLLPAFGPQRSGQPEVMRLLEPVIDVVPRRCQAGGAVQALVVVREGEVHRRIGGGGLFSTAGEEPLTQALIDLDQVFAFTEAIGDQGPMLVRD